MGSAPTIALAAEGAAAAAAAAGAEKKLPLVSIGQEAEQVAGVVGADEKHEVASTVRQFVKSAGDFRKAMQKYIASFADAVTSSELGNAPPCRSYKSLIVLDQFRDCFPLIEAATSKDDIAQALAGLKAYKAAYIDLNAMCKAAANRLKNTVEAAKKKADAEKSNASSVGAKRGCPRKGETAVVGPAVENQRASEAFNLLLAPSASARLGGLLCRRCRTQPQKLNSSVRSLTRPTRYHEQTVFIAPCCYIVVFSLGQIVSERWVRQLVSHVLAHALGVESESIASPIGFDVSLLL